MNRKKIFLVSLLVLLFSISLSACAFLPKEDEKLNPPIMERREVTYKTDEVITGSIQKEITTFGSFSPADETEYRFTEFGGELLEYYVEKGDEVKKGDMLVALEMGDIDKSIRDMKINLERQRLMYEKTKENYNNHKASKYDLQIAQLRYQDIQNKYNDLTTKKESSILRAQSDGTVTYKGSYEPGNMIMKDSTVLKIASNDELKLIITNSSAAEFNAGDKVMIDEVPGTVTAVNKVGKKIHIQPDEMLEGWKINSGVKVVMELDSASDVLLVNKKAVSVLGSQTYVKLLDNGIAVEKPVELGISNNRYYEVISGLKEGDEVIIY